METTWLNKVIKDTFMLFAENVTRDNHTKRIKSVLGRQMLMFFLFFVVPRLYIVT